MTTVDIQSGGHVVHVEHNGDLSYVASKALELFRATEDPRPTHGAVGFTAERRVSREHRHNMVPTTAEAVS